MWIERTKRLVRSGFGIWLASLASVAMAVVACVIWLDRPIALLAYEWFGRHRAVQHLVGTPGFFGPLVVLAFAILLVRWSLACRFGTIDVVANLCVITIAIAEPVKGWLKFVFGRTWPAYGQPSFIFEGAYGFHPFHGGPNFESFPSGHSVAVCAVALILWIYLPIIRTFCAATVAAILLALIAGDFHFLSDVIAGAFVGISLSALVVRVWEDRIRLGLMRFSSPMPRLGVSAGIDRARGSGLEARHRHLYAPERGCHGSKGEIGSDAVR
jgi:membrane-associated phospholipid phosphatase